MPLNIWCFIFADIIAVIDYRRFTLRLRFTFIDAADIMAELSLMPHARLMAAAIAA